MRKHWNAPALRVKPQAARLTLPPMVSVESGAYCADVAELGNYMCVVQTR